MKLRKIKQALIMFMLALVIVSYILISNIKEARDSEWKKENRMHVEYNTANER